MKCEYKYHDGNQCAEETLSGEKYCILHIDFPADKRSKEFWQIKKWKEEKVNAKVDNNDFNFEGAKLISVDFSGMHIQGELNFYDAEIMENVAFDNAIVNGDASFDGAQVRGSVTFNGKGGQVWTLDILHYRIEYWIASRKMSQRFLARDIVENLESALEQYGYIFRFKK